MAEKEFLYQQIYNELLERIISGDLPPGSRLPTEMELTKLYQVSRITSKKALNLLADAGFAIRRSGLGTFVTGNQNASPSPVARTSQKKTIGLIMERIDESYGLDLYYQIDRQAEAMGYRVMLHLSYGSQKRESDLLRFIAAEGADGIIIMPTHGRHYNTDLLRLVLDQFPVLLIDRRLQGIPASAVYSDNIQAGYDLTQHLIQKGHREIGFVMLPSGEALSLDDRLAGYQKALAHEGITMQDQWVLQAHFSTNPSHEGNSNAQADVQQIKAYLEDTPQLTAVVASEYNIAPMVRRAAQDLGLSIPQNLSICCFDDQYDYTGYHYFTHAKQDETALARVALEKLMEMIQNNQGNSHIQDLLIPATLHIGHST